MAIIAAGYADAYSRGLSGKAEMCLHGRRAPILGRVCMQMCAVDVTAIPEAKAGDQVWLRQYGPEQAARLLNRDVLVPRPGGRFAFGRLIDRDEQRVAILPPDPGHRQIVVEHPAWIAAAEMLVRAL